MRAGSLKLRTSIRPDCVSSALPGFAILFRKISLSLSPPWAARGCSLLSRRLLVHIYKPRDRRLLCVAHFSTKQDRWVLNSRCVDTEIPRWHPHRLSIPALKTATHSPQRYLTSYFPRHRSIEMIAKSPDDDDDNDAWGQENTLSTA